MKYEDPLISIGAVDEPLNEVLHLVAEKLQITVSVPAELNQLINCNILQQPVVRALDTLLSDSSYSLESESFGGRLTALVVFPTERTPISEFDADSNTDADINPIEYPSVTVNEHQDVPRQAKPLQLKNSSGGAEIEFFKIHREEPYRPNDPRRSSEEEAEIRNPASQALEPLGL